MKKSYLFVINGMGSGGAERVTAQLSNHFASYGINITIIKLFNDDNFYSLRNDINQISAVRSKKNLKNYIFWAKSIAAAIKSTGATSIIAVGYRFGILSALASFLSKKKPRLIIKLTGDGRPSSIEKLLLRIFKNRIDVIAAQKSEQIPIFLNLCKQVELVPNPFNSYEINRNEGGYNSKRFISIGRFAKQKRFDVLIYGFAKFAKANPNYRLDIYGNQKADPNETRNIVGLIEKLQLVKQVFLHDPTTSIHEKATGSLAFICTSDSEGLPNAFIESMMLGLPVITTSWSGASDLVTDGYNGYLIPVGDSTALAKAMLELAALDKSGWKLLSKNSYEFSSRKFDTSGTYKLWESVIEGK